MASDNGSPLSELSSDAFEAEEERDHMATDALAMPPSKRQKRNPSLEEPAPASLIPPQVLDDDSWAAMSCSEDSEGEVPGSPGGLGKGEDDDVHEQVRTCIWEGCTAGDLGNMDALVNHINTVHVDSKGKKFTCEWMDCSRKSAAHASAYALKSHMRSHTKEKPNYCELPECDRAFTRSDALAKHYRTVHETEALRPSDPIPKSMQASANKSIRIKELMKEPQTPGHTPGPVNSTTNGDGISGFITSYPSELGFTAEEEARGPVELFKLLRRQVVWAEEEAAELKKECEAMEELRKNEWKEKELLLDQAVNADITWQQRRKDVIAGRADLPSAEEIKIAAGRAMSQASPANMVASPSPMPIKAQPAEDRDAAAVLASLAQA